MIGYSPAQQQDCLVMCLPEAGSQHWARRITSDKWTRATSASVGGAPISEAAWVARCLLSQFSPGLTRLAASEIRSLPCGDKAAGAQFVYDFSRMAPEGEGLWVVTLSMMAVGDSFGLTESLLDLCCNKHGRDGPILGGWANVFALLSGETSLATGPVSDLAREKLCRRVAKVIEPSRLGRKLIDIQVQRDPSPKLRKRLIDCGLGNYRWMDHAAQIFKGDGKSAQVFNAIQDAAQWLVEGFEGGEKRQTSIRSRISPARNMIRSGGLQLVSTQDERACDARTVLEFLDWELTPNKFSA